MLQPGRSTAPGQHWFYRVDGHRKCWFRAAETTASVNRYVHHYDHAERQPVAAPEESEAAPRKKTIEDARAQLLSAAPADAPQPTPAAPEPTPSAAEVADAPSVIANADETATPAPAAPIVAEPKIDQLIPEHATRRPVDVEALLAASSLDTVTSSSAPPAAPAAPSIAKADEGRWESMATRAGMVLIALGLVFLAGSLLAGRFLDPEGVPIRRA